MTLNPLVFFGNERLATAVTTDTPVVRSLMEAGYDVKAVVSSFTDGVSRTARSLEIAQTAKQFSLPLLLPERPADIISELKNFGAEAGVLVAYGRIIPQSVIDIFPKGIINIHPSLLPLYRGPTPIETAIIDGARQTGVSLMSLAKEMDAGSVYAQEQISLNGHETKQELADRLLHLGAEMLIENLPPILEGSLAAAPQDQNQASYTHLLAKADGALNWQEPAESLARKVRAFAGYPRARAKLLGHDVIVSSATAVANEIPGQLCVKASTGYLKVDALIAPSGKEITGADFLRGYNR